MDPNNVDGKAPAAKPRSLSRKVVDTNGQGITDYVDLTQLPSFVELREKVQKVVDSSSWFERYGTDWIIHIGGVAGWFLSHFLLASDQVSVFVIGVLVLGFCHSILSLKAGHCALHHSLCQTKWINRMMSFFFSDFIGTFSADVGYSIHIKVHHPHTNIIGLGDSSTWKAPFVPTYLYMFVTPLFLPILTPLVSIKEIIPEGFLKIVRYMIVAGFGLWCHLYLLTSVSHLTISSALLVIFVSRNVLAIPYIHVNIFQHIGLPMYSPKQRPVSRMYQMYTGVLNLPRNPFLDFTFGHGIISCHVEHHLFPQLSDNMCLKVKPVVSAFCKEHDLPYHEDTYMARTKDFVRNYDKLMVNAPPITSFVGLQ